MGARVILAAIAGNLMQFTDIGNAILDGDHDCPEEPQHHRPNHHGTDKRHHCLNIEMRKVLKHDAVVPYNIFDKERGMKELSLLPQFPNQSLKTQLRRGPFQLGGSQSQSRAGHAIDVLARRKRLRKSAHWLANNATYAH